MAKPGRNDPCPCGSGKKYKKCCLTNDEAAENERLVAERAEREERAAAKRQELRKVREAITANFAASDLLDDDFGDELMDASNRVVDLIRAGKLDEADRKLIAFLRHNPDYADSPSSAGRPSRFSPWAKDANVILRPSQRSWWRSQAARRTALPRKAASE